MAQQASIVQDSVDRVREAMSSLESDFEKVQKRAEKKFRSQRKSLASGKVRPSSSSTFWVPVPRNLIRLLLHLGQTWGIAR